MILTDLRAASPAEIDTVLAELDYERFVADTRCRQYLKAAHDARNYVHYDWRTRTRTKRPDLDKAEKMEELAAEQELIVSQKLDEMAPLQDEFFRRGGWTRAFLVVTKGIGHVHSSQSCHTCYPTTQFHWVTAYSGKDEDQVVEDAGERACTICYPSAPVEVLSRTTKIYSPDEQEKMAARAEREAKRAAKDALAVRDPETGKVLFKTERGATNEIAQKLDAYLRYENDEYLAKAAKISLAVAAKRGVDPHELWVELKAKAEVKFRKEVVKRAKYLLALPDGHPDKWQADPANWHGSYKKIALEEGLLKKEAS